MEGSKSRYQVVYFFNTFFGFHNQRLMNKLYYIIYLINFFRGDKGFCTEINVDELTVEEH
jgi:hypothetical protein